MSTKQIIIGALVLALVAFAFGRFTVPQKVVTETKTVYVEKKTNTEDEKKKEDKKHKTIITEVVNPDGTKTTQTIIEEETKTDTETKRTEVTQKAKETHATKTVETQSRLRASVLTGINVTDLKSALTYGGHIEKPILGPITVGVWGISTGVAGFSIGLEF